MAEDTSGSPQASDGAEIRTFLFADFRGYTRFTQDRGDEAASALASRFARLVRDAVPVFGGELLELRGDEALCVFVSARQALRASIELQRRLRTPSNEDASAFPLGVGMGLDAGEAVPTEGGYRGGALNLAARLCATAGPGEVLASEGVVHLARRVDGIRYTPKGERRFKGIADPVRVVQVIPEVALPDPPAPPAAERRTPSLPVAMLTAAAIAAVVVVVLIGVVIGQRGGVASVGVPSDAFGLVDAKGHLRSVAALGQAPFGVAVWRHVAWLPRYADDTLLAVNAATGQGQSVPVGAGPDAVAVGAGVVWVANAGDGTVSEVNATVEKTVGRPIYVGNGPSGIAVGLGAVWVALSVDGAVAKIDPNTGRVVDAFSVGTDPTRVAVGFGKVWVTNESVGTVTPIDPVHDQAGSPIAVGRGPNGIAVGAGAVWVTNGLDGTLTEINPHSLSVSRTVPVGRDPQGVAVVGGTVWVAVRRSGRIVRIDAATGNVVAPLSVGADPQDVATMGDSAAITTTASPTHHRGGTLTIATGPMQTSIDPDSHAAWAVQPWETLAMTNDGLVGFKRVSGPDGETVVADLARALPTPTDGGLTYAFQLRSGIRYSTGRPVRASDIRYGLERTFSVNTGQPKPLGALFYGAIAGASKCTRKPRTCDLSQGIRVDDQTGTITFHLRHPDPDFLAKLAMPLGVAVPSGIPRRDSGDHALPATGPYMITRYAPNQAAILVRNRYFHEWSQDAQPDGYADRIVWRVFQTTTRVVTSVEHGSADWLTDQGPPVTPRMVREIETRFPGQIHPSLFPSTEMLAVVPNTPLAHDLAGRRAVAYAVDRGRISSLLGGDVEARPTCQLLPPNFPGYRPYCPYTVDPRRSTWTAPNVARAHELVRRSASSRQPVSVNAGNPYSAYVVHLLRRLGYKARLTNDEAKVTLVVFSFADDYPGAADFISQFAGPLTSRDQSAALAQQAKSQYQGTLAWAAADRRVTNYAQVIPVATDLTIGLTSKRVGNYEFAPAPGNDPIIDQMWVR